MAKSQMFAAGDCSQTTSTNRFLPFGNASHPLLNGTEGNVTTTISGEGFTLTRLSCMIYSNTRTAGTAEIRFRKNTADGNNVCSIPFGTTGLFSDSTSSDIVAVGNTIDYLFKYGTGGTGQIDLRSISCVIDTTTSNTITRLVAYTNGTFTGTTYSQPVDGTLTYNATESNVQVKIPAGTLKNLYAYIPSNSRDGDSTGIYRINGADSGLGVTIIDTTPGLYQNNTSSVAVADGDLISFKMFRGGSGGAISLSFMSCNFVTTDNSFISIMPGSATVSPVGATAYYLPIGGEANTASTEAFQKQRFYLDNFSANKMRIHLTTNSVASTSTFKLRKNGADTGLSISITASTTGLFEDTTNSVSIANGDDINYVLNAGGSGSMVLKYASIRFYQSATVANPNTYTMFFWT